MITTKEAITNYRRIMMAIETSTKEKQVNIQSERLTKTVEALKEVANRLEASLGVVLSPERSDEDKMGTTQESLCEHATFLRSKVSDITTVTYDLGEIIKRLEI